MPIQVCITVDIEFSIGGAFTDADRNLPIGAPAVSLFAGDQELGLGFILDTLQRFGIKATFFVEALNHCYFGDKPMATLAERILEAGHDIQLHLHPCWLYFRDPNWRRSIRHSHPSDSCAGRDDTELDELISLGLEAFQRWGVPRPVALRTGNLQVDRAVYRAMARHGLRLSSNIAFAICPPADPQFRLLSGRHRIEEIIELPVLTYSDFALNRWRHWHNLTITGASSREMEILLDAAHAQRFSPVVLLTHAFEFVNHNHERFKKLRPHPTNRSRLASLCRHIAEQPLRFAAATFSEGLPSWTGDGDLTAAELHVPISAALSRMLIAKVDDWFRVR